MSNPTHLLLVDLLRQRRELPPQEVTLLLEQLPVLLDDALVLPDSLLNNVGVQFPGANVQAAPQDLARLKVGSWPPFRLNLLSSEAEDGQGSTFGGTLALDSGSAPTRLAALIYELLGGSRRDAWGAVQFSPLPHLNEAANDLLREAFEGGLPSECASFWQRWKKEVAAELKEHGQITSAFIIPDGQLRNAQLGELLELTPLNSDRAPIRISHRPQFRIGRSRILSDFPLRLTAGQEDTDEAVKDLSRVHVLMQRTPVGPVWQDGDGKKGSANGTIFEDAELASSPPTPCDQRGVLLLGNLYRLEMIPAPFARSVQFQPRNFYKWKGSATRFAGENEVFGVILFRPLDDRPILVDAVWLFSDVGFHVAGNSELVWSENLDPTPAWFLHRSGGFWMANAGLAKGEARLDDADVNPGQITPLIDGQILEIGGTKFGVAVSV